MDAGAFAGSFVHWTYKFTLRIKSLVLPTTLDETVARYVPQPPPPHPCVEYVNYVGCNSSFYPGVHPFCTGSGNISAHEFRGDN